MLTPVPTLEERAIAVGAVLSGLWTRHGMSVDGEPLDAFAVRMWAEDGERFVTMDGDGPAAGWWAITATPVLGRDGWWRVGLLHVGDGSAEEPEYDVWCVPQTRRVGFSRFAAHPQ
jgi:hypothetical protein